MPAWAEPTSTHEAKYMQMHGLYLARPTILIHVVRHFKNMFKTVLTQVLLHFAGFLEDEVSSSLRTTELLKEV